MFRKSLLCTASLLSFVTASTAYAQEPAATPGFAEKQSAESCFGAKTLLTTDLDWKETWDRVKNETPDFSTVDTLNIGDKATLILLFSCPTLIEDQARIECDLKITPKDSPATLQQGAVPCFQGRLTRPVEGDHLAQIWLDFDVTAEDGTGPVDFRVGLTDRNAGERLTITLPIEFTGQKASE